MSDDRWLQPCELIGQQVRLLPMTRSHAAALVEAASDGELWRLWYTGVPSAATIDHYIEVALSEQQLGRAMPFVVIDQVSGAVIGSTRFCNAAPADTRVEIGYTWYAKGFQRSAVNSECKLLLLQHAFEQLGAIAVEFRTHWHNQASRAAIARLGAKQDGVLRNHQKSADGCYRDTVVFSIIDSEWPTVRQSLMFKLDR